MPKTDTENFHICRSVTVNNKTNSFIKLLFSKVFFFNFLIQKIQLKLLADFFEINSLNVICLIKINSKKR